MHFGDIPRRYPEVNRSFFLRADGNLNYLQFIDLVKYLWEQGHPDIPIYPNSNNHDVLTNKTYIIYGLELRKAHPAEPKPKYREDIIDTYDNAMYTISGQRFQNMVSFTILNENPRVAEEVIEVFEDFMIEFTPVFKRMGVSEFTYGRRTADTEENRSGSDMTKRTVVYLVTTEKIFKISQERIENIVIDARVWLENNRFILSAATPNGNVTVNIVDQGATPNF